MGLLNLDDPTSQVGIRESEPNRYYGLIQTEHGYGFEVKKKIDVDTGVSRAQTLMLSCKSKSGIVLEVGQTEKQAGKEMQ